ncbi:hypothetical protein BDZ97DRAFT_1764414 [Flammula alnicola]|nr:hypothetical protein BDZ97DRAFT_1764414 [Flammula alnicola]
MPSNASKKGHTEDEEEDEGPQASAKATNEGGEHRYVQQPEFKQGYDNNRTATNATNPGMPTPSSRGLPRNLYPTIEPIMASIAYTVLNLRTLATKDKAYLGRHVRRSVSALPAQHNHRDTDIFPIVAVCTGTVVPSVGCVGIHVVADTCVDFTGGRTEFNHAVSGVQTPNGFICTFFQNFACESLTLTDSVVLAGTFNLASGLVPDGQGNLVNFNDQDVRGTSVLTYATNCSPFQKQSIARGQAHLSFGI